MSNTDDMTDLTTRYYAIIDGYRSRTLPAEDARDQIKALNKEAEGKNLPFVADLSAIDQESGLREQDYYDDYEESSSSEEEDDSY